MTENEPTSVMTKEQCDALADRIAAVLRERKELGAERRRRRLEFERKNGERALARQCKIWERPIEEMELVYATIMASNAAL